MSKLALELCFRPAASMDVWLGALRASWNASVRSTPLVVERPGEGDDQAWSESLWLEIAGLCTADAFRTRNVVGEVGKMRVAIREHEVRFSIAIESDDPTDSLVRLVTALVDIRRPELAMVFDPSSPDDDDLLFAGRVRLDQIPPIFYLDRTALAAFGGYDSVRVRAPGDVHEVPGGLLFVVRTELSARKSRGDLERERALQALLQISPRTPLSLASHDHAATRAGESAWNVIDHTLWPDDDDGILPFAFFAGGDGSWIVGAGGAIARRNGTIWTAVASGVDADLFAVVAIGERDVWTVGDNGTILHWNGDAWSAVASATPHVLCAVWARNSDDIYAVGGAGTILHWNGTAWSAMESPTDRDLFAISGTQDAIWAAGDDGVVLTWNGMAWAPIDAPTRRSIDCVRCVGDDVWLVSGDTIFQWHLGQWNLHDTECERDVRSILVRNENDIWAVGDPGVIRHWDGTRWTALSVDEKARHAFLDVWRTVDGVWVVGTERSILQIVLG
ncbi:MAG: hypothetical protein QM831_35540 [Kofleriaceae bacterium]